MSFEPIQVAVGLRSEVAQGPMRFTVSEDFTGFGADYTFEDLQVAQAVFADLADILADKLNQMAH